MNTPTIFNNSELGFSVRVVMIEDKPWFIAKDICAILNLANSRDAIEKLDSDEKAVALTDTLGGNQQVSVITEAGLYTLILRCRDAVTPGTVAYKFRKWVTTEILPSIRKHGGYMVSRPEESPEEIMARALLLAKETMDRTKEQVKLLENKVEADKPKVLFAESVQTSEDCMLVGTLAKFLYQNGIQTGQNRLYKLLVAEGYLTRRGRDYIPTQKSMDLKIFEMLIRTGNSPDGTPRTSITTKVTGKGQLYFINKFLAQKKADCSLSGASASK